MAERVRIAAIGAGGDGIVETDDGRVFVPYTLAGETVEIERTGNRGRLVRVIEASPERIEPACRHFGVCGGCALQHIEGTAYLAWKESVVAASFRLHGIEAPLAPIVAAELGSRRRALLAAVKTAKGVTLGFHRRGSHEIVPIEVCPVLAPAIVAHLDALRAMAAIAIKPRHTARLTVVAADNGLDIAIAGGRRLDAGALAALAAFAADGAIARLTVDETTAFMNRRPEIAVDGAALLPEPGGFTQAVPAAEAALAAAVSAGVGEAGPVADLFAGIGTFSLRLARRAAVTAVESDPGLLAALHSAARHARGLRPVTAVRRDLFANPLATNELAAFGAVVFDPPAAGAKRQAEALAASPVAKVVAVSCNPATLARDARILVDGGYRLTRVTPVDQFLWSAEIEAVAAFER